MSRAIGIIIDELAVAVVEQGENVDSVLTDVQSAILEQIGAEEDRVQEEKGNG